MLKLVQINLFFFIFVSIATFCFAIIPKYIQKTQYEGFLIMNERCLFDFDEFNIYGFRKIIGL